jgi:hypothetical protein
VFADFMTKALANEPDAGLPDPGPVCARSGSLVNPTGGHGGSLPTATPTPQLPTVQQQPTAPAPTTPTTPAATTPTTPAVTTPATPNQGNG